jgi:hypothetical protein
MAKVGKTVLSIKYREVANMEPNLDRFTDFPLKHQFTVGSHNCPERSNLTIVRLKQNQKRDYDEAAAATAPVANIVSDKSYRS